MSLELTEYCDILLSSNALPCFVVDNITEEVLYANTAMYTLLKTDDSVVGKIFHELIRHKNSEFEHRDKNGLNFGEFQERTVCDTRLNIEFLATHTKLEFNGNVYTVCKYTPVDENSTMSLDYATKECINILHQNLDRKDTINAFLDLLRQYYESKIATVYYVNAAERMLTNIDMSLAPGEIIDTNVVIDIGKVLDWMSQCNEVGIIDASRNYKYFEKDSMEQEFLDAYKYDNFALSVIKDDNNEIIAVVGVGERRNPTTDYSLLQTITSFIRQYVTNIEQTVSTGEIEGNDVLTGFLNRNSYSNKIDFMGKNLPKTLGVVFVNVNGLKKVNAEYGYAKGDNYIKQSAELLKEHFKNIDFYRISGDEFVGFFEDIEKADFEALVSNLHSKMKKEENYLFAIGSMWSSGRYDLFKLVQDTDILMYINKQEYYHKSKRTVEEISDSTLSDLLKFLANDEFMIYLQPQVLLEDASLHGAEALIRRFDKTNQKMVFPDQFIPLYEKKSIIRHVDMFVVDKVCQLLSEWRKTYKLIPISVNLSRVTLLEFGIVDTITQICDKYDIPHDMLIIEVTERVGLIENNVASSLITEFEDNGFKISLDDFGCAYSNIVTLAQISVDEVKIDKSLVDYIVENEKNQILVKNILTMCNELKGTCTLAEGIENKEQADLLREYNCTLGQGYYYSRPIPTDEFFDKYINNLSNKN